MTMGGRPTVSRTLLTLLLCVVVVLVTALIVGALGPAAASLFAGVAIGAWAMSAVTSERL